MVAPLTRSVDWNCNTSLLWQWGICRSSHEERGLKWYIDCDKCKNKGCRSSHEERGLKSLVTSVSTPFAASLLSRGAWIEISILWYILFYIKVAPLTRSVDWNVSAFGDIINLLVAPLTRSVDWNSGWCDSHCSAACRSSHEERGLKYILWVYRYINRYVAPLTRSVDWNLLLKQLEKWEYCRSSHEERGLK